VVLGCLIGRRSAHLVLFSGLVLVSTSGPFIVQAHMDAYAVVLLRTALAAALFLVVAAARGRLRLERVHRARVAVGGVLLGAHFLLWVKAFDLTDFASNLLLLVAQPVMAAVLGIRLGEHPTRGTWVSIALALAGLAVIAGGDVRLGTRALGGDAMCIVGGLAITLFYVITRDARAATPIETFMGATLVAAAAAAAPVALWARAPLTYPATSWAWLAALVVLTTALGHGLLNLAARHVRLFTLNVVIVLEPAIAIGIGALLFGARITPLQVSGGVLLGTAVVVGLAPERRPRATTARSAAR
jgi:drug/metabolite transporter (DMT)-like permease